MSEPRAIVAGHGDFAAGLVSAVAQIVGRQDRFVPLTNRGLGREDIERTLRAALEQSGADVIFTDLPAGSWTFIARKLQRERPALVLVTGANLVSLLDFALGTEERANEAARQAVDKGRAALGVVEGRRDP